MSSKQLTRRAFLQSTGLNLGALTLCGCITQPARSTEKRPNILLALADDWGWPHAGAYGDKVVKTPTFDRLAREGVLFEHS